VKNAFLHSVEKGGVFYLESILGKLKMDKKNVQKRKGENTFPEIHVFAA
jgi:hypothetical protein